GVEKLVRWHQGRCLSYGEGVAYWALAEMIRARAGIVEEEDTASARAKLRATVEEHVAEERERRLVEPRLAHLLGLEQRIAPGRADDLRARIARSAEGMPLYAVETVRMLLDRGLVAQDGARYVVTGDVTDLDVPETLHALVAARLDGLDAGERALLQDAAVLG